MSLRVFTVDALDAATDGFAASRCIGEGISLRCRLIVNDAHGTASMWNQAGQSNSCQRSVHSYIFDPASALFMMSCK